MKTQAQHLASLALSVCLAACASGGGKGSSNDTTGDGSTTGVVGGVSAGTTAGTVTAGGTTVGTTSGGTTGGTTGSTPGPDGTVAVKTATVAVTPSASNPNAGQAMTLNYAIVRNSTAATTPAAKQWSLTIASYDPYGWGLRDNYAGHPNTAYILGLYLQTQTAGTNAKPAVGTYNVQTPAANATGMFIDPAISGYEVFAGTCTGSYPLLAPGGTVTLTAVDTTGTIVSGSINVSVLDPSASGAAYATLSGTFTTQAPVANEASGAPATATECAW